MAYGAKYVLTFSDIYQNTTQQYEAIIYKKDYTGPVYEVAGSGQPLIIETDRSASSQYRPIIATKASLNLNIISGALRYWNNIPETWNSYDGLWNGDSFDIQEFVTADIDTFILEVSKNDTVIWKGHYVYTSDLEIQEIEPILLTLQFSDIQLIKVNRFYNFQDSDTNKQVKYKCNDMRSILDIIMRCTYYTGITEKTRINISTTLENSYTAAESTTLYADLDLDEMLVQANAFLIKKGQYDTIYNVLAGVCSQFGLVAYFSGSANGYVLNVRSYDSLVNSNSFPFTLCEITGFVSGEVLYSPVSTGTATDSTVALNSSTFKNIGRSQSIRFNYPDESVAIANKSSLNANLPNYNFSVLSQVLGSPFNDTYVIPNWYNPDGENPGFAPVSMGATSFGVTPFASYSTDAATSVPSRIASQVHVKTTANFSTTIFIDSEWISISSQNHVSMAFSALTDGRLKNLTAGQQTTYRPTPQISLIMESKQGDTFYFNFQTKIFDYVATFSTSLPNYTDYLMPWTLTLNYIGNSDRFYYEFNEILDIGDGAKIKYRFYKPYRGVSVANGWSYEYGLYLEYLNLQVFNGDYIGNAISNQSFISSYDITLNSDEQLTLDSNLFMLDGTNSDRIMNINTIYIDRQVPAMQFGNALGNQIVDKYTNPASSLSFYPYKVFVKPILPPPPPALPDYYNLEVFLQNICIPIQKNSCLNNVTIQGTFKSSFYPIGTKFTYSIVGYDSRTFALLDYRMDVKDAAQDSIIYSSEFIDDTDITRIIEVTTN